MTYIDQGKTGAKRATWRDVNPRELLQRIINENPGDDEAAWREMFWAAVQRDQLYLYAVCSYWLDNNIRSITKRDYPSQVRLPLKERESQIEQVKQNIVRRVEQEAKLLLLGMMTPCGKILRECTGAECGRMGGWYSRLASVVAPKRKVGATLSEGQLQDLWKAQ